MKNNSNKNYMKKNNKSKRNNRSEHYSKFSDTNVDKKVQARNNRPNTYSSKINSDSKLFSKKRSKDSNNVNYKFSKRIEDNHQESTNKKIFEDWIWGKHSVHAVLTSGRAINRIWCTSEIFSSEKFYILLKDLKSKGVLVEEVSWNRLSQLTFGANHQGIAMQLASSKTVSLQELINISKTNSTNPIILALDGITDPHNLGAIIRSAEAFDCKGIVLPQRRSAGLTGTVAKVAAGALEHIPVSRVVNLNRALDELKSNGFITVGLSADGSMTITNFKEKSPIVVIVGAEDKGISLLAQKKCNFSYTNSTQRKKISSLNASVAAAISLFHITHK